VHVAIIGRFRKKALDRADENGQLISKDDGKQKLVVAGLALEACLRELTGSDKTLNDK